MSADVRFKVTATIVATVPAVRLPSLVKALTEVAPAPGSLLIDVEEVE